MQIEDHTTSEAQNDEKGTTSDLHVLHAMFLLCAWRELGYPLIATYGVVVMSVRDLIAFCSRCGREWDKSELRPLQIKRLLLELATLESNTDCRLPWFSHVDWPENVFLNRLGDGAEVKIVFSEEVTDYFYKKVSLLPGVEFAGWDDELSKSLRERFAARGGPTASEIAKSRARFEAEERERKARLQQIEKERRETRERRKRAREERLAAKARQQPSDTPLVCDPPPSQRLN